MKQDVQKKDSFSALMQTQESVVVPDFLEAGIMTKISAQPQKSSIPISLQSVFILSSIAAIYVILLVLSAYFPVQKILIQEINSLVGMLFWVKLCYDLNDWLTLLFQRLVAGRKTKHTKTVSL